MAQADGGLPARGVAALAPPLAPFVRAHCVCWEIAPHVEAGPGGLRRDGVELVLHAQVAHNAEPGAPEAQALHERLREIVLQAAPRDVRQRVLPFLGQLHFRGDTRWRAEVDLVLETDAAAARATARMLLRLGVPEGVYAKSA